MGLHPTQPPNLADVILVAIDFENPDGIGSRLSDKLRSQAGLAIFDTKQLEHTSVAPDQAIAVYNFVTGPRYYVSDVNRKFLFGKARTARIRASEMAESVISPHRNVVIIGHAVANELYVLQFLKISFRHTPIVLDTDAIAEASLGLKGLSLSRLLATLGCPFDQLHYAGNDAFFSLRALLLLAILECAAEAQIQYHARLDAMRCISAFPTASPTQFDPLASKPPKKSWRTSKTTRVRKTPRSAAEQDQIRDQRQRMRNDKEDFENGALVWDLEAMLSN